MKKHLVKIAALAFLMAFALTSCQKDSVESDDTQISAAQSSSEASGTIEDVSDEADYRLSPNTPITGCPTITSTATMGSYPNTITIDFGSSCTGRNGRILSGKIIVDVTDAYHATGSVRTTHTDGLTVDGNSVEFNRVVTNQGQNGLGQLYWTVSVTGTRVRGTDGTTATWSAERIRTLVEGQSTTDNLEDDVVEITGTATGTCHQGRAFTSTITTPLVKRADCKWIVSGVEQISSDGRNGTRNLDFGDGSCDDKGTITLRNGDTKEITLFRRR